MAITIRDFKTSDKQDLIRLVEELHDYLAPLDPLGRMKRQLSYGQNEINNLLKSITGGKGIIYIAESDSKIVGFIAGVITTSTRDDLLGYLPAKRGRVEHLIVSTSKRGKGVGQLLIEKIEVYFKEKDCDFIRIEVFEPNKLARSFYEKMGYRERDIDLIKPLKRNLT